MRWDMHKVICERPRKDPYKLKYRYLRREKNSHGEEQPFYESMRARYGRRESRVERKQLNEHLRPLERFLFSRVGKPWNNTYQIICRAFKCTNAIKVHIHQHIPDYVDGLNVQRGLDIEGSRVLYVDEEGILRKRRERKQPAPYLVEMKIQAHKSLEEFRKRLEE